MENKTHKNLCKKDDSIAVEIDVGISFQQIDGFGGQWVPFDTPCPAGKGHRWGEDTNNRNREYLLTSVFPELSTRMFRTDITWPKDAYEVARDYDWYVDIFKKPEYDYIWRHFKKLEEFGVEVILSRWGTPPRFIITGLGPAYGDFIDTDSNYDEIADFWTAICYVAKKIKGHRLERIQLFNEINANWGVHFTPEQYVIMLKKIGERLDRNGLNDVKIIGPDTWFSVDLPAYVDKLTDEPYVMNYIAAFETHGWEDYRYPVAYKPGQMVKRAEEAAKIAREKGYGHIPFYIGEFGNFYYGNYANNYVVPGTSSNTDSYDYGFYTVQAMHHWLTADMPLAAVFMWDSYDYMTTDGLVRPWGMRMAHTLDWQARPVYNLVYHFSKYIKPGSLRIKAVSNDGSILASAYKNGDEVTAVIINTDTCQTKSLSIHFNNIPVGCIDMIVTSEERKNNYYPALCVDEGNITIEIPQKSIITLTNMGKVTLRTESDNEYKDVYQVRCCDNMQFTANVAGKDNEVLWSVVGGEDYGTITQTGHYTAPAGRTEEFVIIKAVSMCDSSQMGYGFVKITD